MIDTLRSQLLCLADAFSGATFMTRPSIGKAALNDNTFFRRVEAGDNFTVKTFARLVQWFSDNWPETTPWPNDIARPIHSEHEAAE
jgi:hypothetical protein